MKRKTCSIMLIGALALAGFVASCSSVLGLKDPTLEDGQGVPADAAIDVAMIDAAPIDTLPAGCQPAACPFGCDPDKDACRPEKLFVFLTTGSFFGDGFKGSPVDVRGTADALCFDTLSKKFANRACTKARTHAILTVSGSDSIQVMASTYSIPFGAPVHRADTDDVVFNSWNDLTDPNKAPRGPVAFSTDDADGIAWTGFGGGNASNCTGWTMKPGNGAAAHTSIAGATPGKTWLGQDSLTCDTLRALLCVCWSGGT